MTVVLLLSTFAMKAIDRGKRRGCQVIEHEGVDAQRSQSGLVWNDAPSVVACRDCSSSSAMMKALFVHVATRGEG